MSKHLIKAACFSVLLEYLIRVRLDLTGQLLHEGAASGPFRDGLSGVIPVTAVCIAVIPSAAQVDHCLSLLPASRGPSQHVPRIAQVDAFVHAFVRKPSLTEPSGQAAIRVCRAVS